MSEWIWYDKGDGRQVMRKVKDTGPIARSDTVAAPLIISDSIEVQSMVDGRMYSSKAALRQSYRDKGYIEVGNETQKAPELPKPDRKAVRETAAKALSQVGISV